MALLRKTNISPDIYNITTMVAGTLSLEEVLDRLAEIAVNIVKVRACSIRLLDEATNELKMSSTYGLSELYKNKGDVSKDDPVIKEAFEGGAVVVNDMRKDSRVKYPLAAAREGIASQLTVAMMYKEKPIGVLRLYSPKVKRFSDDEVALARMVASQCAVAIVNARLYSQALEGAHMKEQMRLAGVIQRRMLPKKAPKVPRFDIYATYRPCFNVGGDLYDFIKVNEHTFVAAIADVIGKGIPAAIMMAMFSGGLRAYVKQIASSCGDNCGDVCLEEIVKNLNEKACKDCRDGEFITMFIAMIDVKAMTMTYCNCGHEPAIKLSNGNLESLDQGGLVLGIDKDASYTVTSIKLQDGDSFVLYTDGLIDAVNFDGKLWGLDNMLAVLAKYDNWSAEIMVKNLLRYRRRFVGLAPQLDDTSIVNIKVDVSKV